jgi:hypothetical protein
VVEETGEVMADALMEHQHRKHEWMEWSHRGKGVPWRAFPADISEFNALLDAGWEIVHIDNTFTVLHRAVPVAACPLEQENERLKCKHKHHIANLRNAIDQLAEQVRVESEGYKQMCFERDEAIRTRNLAQEASNRDLEAKRAAETKANELRAQCLSALAGKATAINQRAQMEYMLEKRRAELKDVLKATRAAERDRDALAILLRAKTSDAEWTQCPASLQEAVSQEYDKLRADLQEALGALRIYAQPEN